MEYFMANSTAIFDKKQTAVLEHALAAGRLLAEAKSQLPHGAWSRWLADNFEGSERTAQAYMRVATRWPEIEAKAQRVADLSYRDAVKLLAEPRESAGPKNETARPAWAIPACWSHNELNAQAAKLLNVEAAIGSILEWADVNGGGPCHKLFRWLCPAQGWMNRDRALSMIHRLWKEDVRNWPDDTHQSMWDLLAEVACHYAGILPLDEGGYPLVCMCDLAIGIHKFAGDTSPDEEPHRIAPCDQYQDGCVFGYCHAEADKRQIDDTVKEWLKNGPPENVYDAIFGTEAAT